MIEEKAGIGALEEYAFVPHPRFSAKTIIPAIGCTALYHRWQPGGTGLGAGR
jgi:hypothetical protein